MIKFDKSDIPPLDFIIDKLSNNIFFIGVDDMKKAGFLVLKNDGYSSVTQKLDERNEFERLLNIIDSYDCAECSFNELFGNDPSVELSQKTLQFKKDGGFKKAYKDFKNKEKRDKLELKLAESNIKANKLNEKNSRVNNRVNITNIIIGVVSILVALGLGWWSYKAVLLK